MSLQFCHRRKLWVGRAAMVEIMVLKPLSLSRDLSFRFSRSSGELGNRGCRPAQGSQIKGLGCLCSSRSFVPGFRSFDCCSTNSDSICLVSWGWCGNFTENDTRLSAVQGLGRIVGVWSRKKIGGRKTRSEGGGGRWKPEWLTESSNRIVMRSGGDNGDDNSGEDQVETLFMRELRRRGMSSKERDGSLGSSGTDTKAKEEGSEAGGTFGRGWSLPGAARTKPPPQMTQAERDEQLKRSMALNSEGLDGLFPRGIELLKLGGSFFLAFWPLILASLAAFVSVYLYLGSAFIHTGNSFEDVGRPPYVDPYQLLEEEVLPPQMGPNRVPYNERIDSTPQ